WFNHEWLKRIPDQELLPRVKTIIAEHGITADDRYVSDVLALVRERLTFLTEYWEQASFFFKPPETYDMEAVTPKWNEQKTAFFTDLISGFEGFEPWHAAELEHFFKLSVQAAGLKPGDVMLPFRIMLVGGKFGPQVFDIAALLG